MMLTLVIFAIFGIVAAMLWNEGLWSCALMVINATLGGLIAINYYEPLANWLETQQPSYTYFWDYLCLWLLFAVSTGVLRAITDTLSRHKVKFKFPVEVAGKVILALYVGWILVSFTLFTLHTAPLPTSMYQVTPTSKNLMNGDRRWLSFMYSLSRGALARGQEFDPRAEFIPKYRQRRAIQEQLRDFRVPQELRAPRASGS